MSPATAPSYYGWRFIADGRRQGFYDKSLVRDEDWEDDALPDDHPAWVEDQRNEFVDHDDDEE